MEVCHCWHKLGGLSRGFQRCHMCVDMKFGCSNLLIRVTLSNSISRPQSRMGCGEFNYIILLTAIIFLRVRPRWISLDLRKW